MPSFAPSPAGYRVRPLRLDDVDVLVGLESAYKRAISGDARTSRQAVFGRLSEPGFDPARDGCLVLGAGGEAVGHAMVFDRGTGFALDVVALEPAVLAWLFRQATERAREIARSAGAAEVTVKTGVHRGDHVFQALAAGLGLERVTTYQRMQIDHTRPVVAPRPPTGVTIRRGAPDEATRRAAHGVLTGSFSDQSGAEARAYDDWVATREARPCFDWSMVTVLELAGRPVAMRECNDLFVESDGCGYIGRLGVAQEARGRGLAKFLLRDAFAHDAARGCSGTFLHVDANNPTPAVALYLSVGMRAVSALDFWEGRLPTVQ